MLINPLTPHAHVSSTWCRSPLHSEVLVPSRICLPLAPRPGEPLLSTSFPCPGPRAWPNCLCSGPRTDLSLFYILAEGQAEWVLKFQQDKLNSTHVLEHTSDRELTTTQGPSTGAKHCPGSLQACKGGSFEAPHSLPTSLVAPYRILLLSEHTLSGTLAFLRTRAPPFGTLSPSLSRQKFFLPFKST